MCLMPEWFTEREARLERLAQQGCVDLASFIAEHGLTWADLRAAGFLCGKETLSTAELLEDRPTERGREYLMAREAYDILVVRKGKGPALLAAVLLGKPEQERSA